MTWSEAFLEQARSDMAAYEALNKTALPVCHRLHYLQMWLEKLCKAHLWAPGFGNDALRFHHQVVAIVLPSLVAARWRSMGFASMPDIGALRALCREVDLLHPQVDDNGRRPDNVEYPWRSLDGRVQAPAKEKVESADRLSSRRPSFAMLLKAAKILTLSKADDDSAH